MTGVSCLTKHSRCNTVRAAATNKSNCDRCTTTHHSSDPALNIAVGGLRRIILEARSLENAASHVTDDPTALSSMGCFLCWEVGA